jgi:RNA polymerase sigma-70 factor (ECF subfamily)
MTTEPTRTPATLGDATLVEMIRSGDPRVADDGFRTIHDRYGPALIAFLASRLDSRSDADDLFQDLWLRAVKALREGRFDGHNLKAWLFQIARRLIIDQARRAKRAPSVGVDDDLQGRPGNTPEDILIGRERQETLARCLEGLKPKERAVFEGRMGDVSHDEIAKRLEVPVKEVYKLLFNAKAKLKSCVERSGR